MHHEIDFLRNENQDQNIQIALLKEMMIEWNQQQQDRPVQSNEPNIKEHQEFEEMVKESRHEGPVRKRPARLLPIKFLYGERKNDTADNYPPKFYGPPTSCSDLTKLGYTLNGFYQVNPILNVQSKNSTDDLLAQLETVYCAFKQPEETLNASSKVEKRIIAVPKLNQPKDKEVIVQQIVPIVPISKDVGIHFYALSKQFGPPFNRWVDLTTGILQFREVILNLGGAFHQSNGTFTAPKSGYYRFFFQMLLRPLNPEKKSFDEEKMLDSSFIILKNGEPEEFIGITGFFVSRESVLYLEKRDNISLRDNNFQYADRTFQLIDVDSFWFSGSILN